MKVRPWMLVTMLIALAVIGGLVTALAIRAEGFRRFDAAVAAYRAAGHPVAMAELAAQVPLVDPVAQGRAVTMLKDRNNRRMSAKVSAWFDRPIGIPPVDVESFVAGSLDQRTKWQAVPDEPVVLTTAAFLQETLVKDGDFGTLLRYPASRGVPSLSQTLALMALGGDVQALSDLDRLTRPWPGPKRLLDTQIRLSALAVADQTHLALAWRGEADPYWDAWMARRSDAIETSLTSGEIDIACAIWYFTEHSREPGQWWTLHQHLMATGTSYWWEAALKNGRKILKVGSDEAVELAAIQADQRAMAGGGCIPPRRMSSTIIGTVFNMTVGGVRQLWKLSTQAQVSHRTTRLAAYVLRQADAIGHLPATDDPVIIAACAPEADPQPLSRIPLVYEIISPLRFRIAVGAAPAGTLWASNPDWLPAAIGSGSSLEEWSLAPRDGVLPCIELRP